MWQPLKGHYQGDTPTIKRRIHKCNTAYINVQLCILTAKLYKCKRCQIKYIGFMLAKVQIFKMYTN